MPIVASTVFNKKKIKTSIFGDVNINVNGNQDF